MKTLLLVVTHLVVGVAGFALGVYMLPILVAPDAPPLAELESRFDAALFTTEFRRDLPGSDAFHWGEGRVAVGEHSVALMGELAPGPDYKLYLSPVYVDDAAKFEAAKPRMALVGDVNTFENFLVTIPGTIDPRDYTTVVVWCERFRKFISAGQYR